VADSLPPGIHFRSGETPPDFFRFATFNFTPTATAVSAKAALTAIWALLEELRLGEIADLRATRPSDPRVRVEAGDLCFMLCIGPKLFDGTGRQEPLVSADLAPDRMPVLSALPTGPFPALRWADGAQPLAAQTDFAIQLTATSELAAVRPIVEIQKLIDDQALPVRLVSFFGGLHRDDRRSWIDFHDGINNMPSDERLEAMEIRQSPQAWMLGGTTLGFLKIAIDMQGWRKLSREQQEALVGRDKLSGCPIAAINVDQTGTIAITRSGCPLNAEIGVGPGWTDAARDPTPSANPLVQTSHIYRANRTRQPPATDAARRIYRQGYEFVDSPPGGGVRVGLNFVGFQRDTEILLNILRSKDWLGDANFGGIPGDPNIPAFTLMSVVAGGLFAVPPVGDPFPGSSLFDPVA
jgi:deferrochelatase/peroxidase EfeB